MGLEKLRTGLRILDGLGYDGHLYGGASAGTFCSVAWLFWHLAALPESTRASMFADAGPQGSGIFLEGSWVRAAQAAIDGFGCEWGFSAQLPRGFFRALEASSTQEALTLVQASRSRFGRFYPVEA